MHSRSKYSQHSIQRKRSTSRENRSVHSGSSGSSAGSGCERRSSGYSSHSDRERSRGSDEVKSTSSSSHRRYHQARKESMERTRSEKNKFSNFQNPHVLNSNVDEYVPEAPRRVARSVNDPSPPPNYLQNSSQPQNHYSSNVNLEEYVPEPPRRVARSVNDPDSASLNDSCVKKYEPLPPRRVSRSLNDPSPPLNDTHPNMEQYSNRVARSLNDPIISQKTFGMSDYSKDPRFSGAQTGYTSSELNYYDPSLHRVSRSVNDPSAPRPATFGLPKEMIFNSALEDWDSPSTVKMNLSGNHNTLVQSQLKLDDRRTTSTTTTSTCSLSPPIQQKRRHSPMEKIRSKDEIVVYNSELEVWDTGSKANLNIRPTLSPVIPFNSPKRTKRPYPVSREPSPSRKPSEILNTVLENWDGPSSSRSSTMSTGTLVVSRPDTPNSDKSNKEKNKKGPDDEPEPGERSPTPSPPPEGMKQRQYEKETRDNVVSTFSTEDMIRYTQSMHGHDRSFSGRRKFLINKRLAKYDRTGLGGFDMNIDAEPVEPPEPLLPPPPPVPTPIQEMKSPGGNHFIHVPQIPTIPIQMHHPMSVTDQITAMQQQISTLTQQLIATLPHAAAALGNRFPITPLQIPLIPQTLLPSSTTFNGSSENWETTLQPSHEPNPTTHASTKPSQGYSSITNDGNAVLVRKNAVVFDYGHGNVSYSYT